MYELVVIMKQCALPVFTIMTLWIMKYNPASSAQVHELSQSHFGDNREGTLFHGYMYITLILLL